MAIITSFKREQSKLQPTFTAKQRQRTLEKQDHRVKLGQGREIFELAKQLIKDWHVFNTPDCIAFPPKDEPTQGQTTVSLLREFGLWFLISCRIIEVIDTQTAYGFTYETLPGHVECGVETFVVEMDVETTDVTYIVHSKSNHHSLLFWLGSPIVHWLQRRYKINSAKHMLKMCTKQ